VIVTRVDLSRRVSADPASVALLLGGPALPPVDDARDGDANRHVTVGPPVRTSIGFSASVAVDVGSASGHGRLRVTADGPAATDVQLGVVVPDGDGDGDAKAEASADAVRAVAAGYLDRLTHAAEARAHTG